MGNRERWAGGAVRAFIRVGRPGNSGGAGWYRRVRGRERGIGYGGFRLRLIGGPFREPEVTDPAAFLAISFRGDESDVRAVGMEARLAEPASLQQGANGEALSGGGRSVEHGEY